MNLDWAKDFAFSNGASEEEAGLFSRYCQILSGTTPDEELPLPQDHLNMILSAYIPEGAGAGKLPNPKNIPEDALLAVLTAIKAFSRKPLFFPARIPAPNSRIPFYVREAGWAAKGILERFSKEVFLFHIPVEVDAVLPDKVERPLTVGKWLFGAPGFQAHLAAVPEPEDTTVTVIYSSPESEVEAKTLEVLIRTAAWKAGWKKIGEV